MNETLKKWHGKFNLRVRARLEKSEAHAITFICNGFRQSIARLRRIDLNLVVGAIDLYRGLRVQFLQRLSHCFFTMAAGHAFNGENLVHDGLFDQFLNKLIEA